MCAAPHSAGQPRTATGLRTVLFDLDGTLVDTAPDLARALNQALRAFGHPELPFERIRPVVSHGAGALIRLGTGLTPEDPGYEPRRQALLDHYAAHIADHSHLFPGMDRVLAHLEARGLRWGVVTNKPRRFSEPLLEALDLRARAASLVCGDTLARNKPHPDPLLLACRDTGVGAAECLYVGDAERDIEAGRRAGMHTAVALFGYLEPGARPEHWGADLLLAAPTDLLHWLGPAEAR